MGDSPKAEAAVLVATLTSLGVRCLILMHEVTVKHLKQAGKVLGRLPVLREHSIKLNKC